MKLNFNFKDFQHHVNNEENFKESVYNLGLNRGNSISKHTMVTDTITNYIERSDFEIVEVLPPREAINTVYCSNTSNGVFTIHVKIPNEHAIHAMVLDKINKEVKACSIITIQGEIKNNIYYPNHISNCDTTGDILYSKKIKEDEIELDKLNKKKLGRDSLLQNEAAVEKGLTFADRINRTKK